MLPTSLLTYRIRDNDVVPHYLTARDEVWVRLLLDELDALVGRTVSDAECLLAEKVARLSAEYGAPLSAVGAVGHILLRTWRSRVSAAVPPAEIRRVLSGLVSDPARSPTQALNRAAATLGIRVEEVSRGLFADRPGERRLQSPAGEPTPRHIAALHNLALAQALLLRTEEVVVRVTADVRSVVRSAKQKKLLCVYSVSDQGAEITLSGPRAMPRQSFKYGLALASFLPSVLTTRSWSLEATCFIEKRRLRFGAHSGDPLATMGPVDREVDTRVERSLLRDFRRLGSAWTLTRETIAVPAGRRTFFPDFTLQRGTDRVYVEIVGFYTAEHLASRIKPRRDALVPNVVVCVDGSLACSPGDIAASNVVRFHKRIDARALVAAAERTLKETPQNTPNDT